ncbi:MAG: hypothetical protein A2516_09985 [Alphaproteobacteria bacterium RIFOXYD12_FULL_60_8]|nr:MAG: hypothetical protein A2516_09985 [Alphaproteobacteria bacterium RIFOXYD12_FULL_60_8]
MSTKFEMPPERPDGETYHGLDGGLKAAMAHQKAGRLDRAEAICAHLTGQYPNSGGAHNLTGVLGYLQGRPLEAMESFSRALTADPSNPAYHINMAGVLRTLKRPALAVDTLKVALTIDATNADAHHNLAVLLREMGRLSDAETHARLACHLKPQSPAYANHLGVVLTRLGRYDEARTALDTALDLGGDPSLVHKNLGILLAEQKRLSEAVEQFRLALPRRADDAELHGLLGDALHRMGQLAEAEQELTQARDLNPRHAEVQMALGALLAQTGRQPEAEQAYRAALEARPDHPRALYHVALRAVGGEDATAHLDIAALDAALSEESLNASDRRYLLYAAGEVLAAQGDFDGAFARFQTANDTRRKELEAKGMAFDVKAHHEAVQSIIDHVKPDALSGGDDLPDGDGLVFLVGMPQAGARTLAAALERHTEVAVMNENYNLAHLATALGYPLNFSALDRDKAHTLATEYVSRVRAAYPSAKRVIDPTASNFLRLGLIGLLFPKAKIITVRRNAMDCCLWAFTRNINMSWPFSHRLTDLGWYYLEHERLMAHWHLTLPTRIETVRFEDFASEPDRVIRTVLRDLDLTWEKDCTLDIHALSAVRQSIGRWNPYRSHLIPLMQALSGELTFDEPSTQPAPEPLDDEVVSSPVEPPVEPPMEPPVEPLAQRPAWSLAELPKVIGAAAPSRPVPLPPIILPSASDSAPNSSAAAWSLAGLAPSRPVAPPLIAETVTGEEASRFQEALGRALGFGAPA